MTRIIFERHGQSMANLKNCFAGHTDVELSELGRVQAEKAAKYIIENYKVDKIFSSDLQRAYYTAEPVAKRLGMEIIKVEELREINGGEWENKSVQEIDENYSEERKLWKTDIGSVRIPGGESVAELMARILKISKKLASENDGKTILLATHAAAIRAISCVATGTGIEGMKNMKWVRNASITIMDFCDNKLELKEYGYDEYLDGIKTPLIV